MGEEFLYCELRVDVIYRIKMPHQTYCTIFRCFSE